MTSITFETPVVLSEADSESGLRRSAPPALEVAAVSFLMVDMGNGVMRASGAALMAPADARAVVAQEEYARLNMVEAPAARDVTIAVLKSLGVGEPARLHDAVIDAYAKVVDDQTFNVVTVLLGIV